MKKLMLGFGGALVLAAVGGVSAPSAAVEASRDAAAAMKAERAEADQVVAEAPAGAASEEQAVDDIDLEEVDDSAEAAQVASITVGEGDLIDISCDNVTISDVLRQFRRTTSANIISCESTNLQRRVSAELKQVNWRTALESILNSRGFRLESRGEINFVVEDKVEEPFFTRTFKLSHAAAADIEKLINESYAPKGKDGKVVKTIASSFPEANVVVVTATEKVLTDCERIIEAVDRAAAQIYIEARFLELSSDAKHALGLDWSTLNHWGVSLKNFKAGFGVANGKVKDYGTFLTERESQTQLQVQDQTQSGDSSKNTHQNQTQTQDQDTLTGLVPQQIAEAAGGALSSADMGWRNSYGFSGLLSADEFSLALSAFESLSEGQIFSNPKIIVANGKEAKVDMSTKEPNIAVEANYTGTSSQNMNISTKMEAIPGNDPLMFAGEAFFSYGITLSVKPRISPDGLINVEIVPTISEWVRDKEVHGASQQSVYTTYPVISVKRLTTNFTMQDGGTAVIGGLTRTEEMDVDDGIPYLRKIPWIGPRLFGSKKREKVQKEILVFVTVGIANPAQLPKDVGLPTNAVIGREYVSGERNEPGLRDGSARKVMALDMTELDEREGAEASVKSAEGKDDAVPTVEPTWPSGEPAPMPEDVKRLVGETAE